jgi:hypothetical protein
MIGGKALGAGRWLYCDANRTWIMRIEKNFDTRTIDVYVEKLFGVFSGTTYPAVEKKILAYAPTSDWLFNDEHSFTLRYFPSKTGAKVAVNLMYAYSYAAGRVTSLPLTAMKVGSGGTYNDLEEAFTITLSGNGSTALATLGTGIAASAALHVAGYDNTYTYTETGAPQSGYPCNGSAYSAGSYPDCSGDAGSYYKTWEWGWSYEGTLLYYMSAAGVLKTVTYAWSTLTTAEASADVSADAYESPPGNWFCAISSVSTAQSASTTLNYSITVAGSTYTYPAEETTYSYSSSWSRGDTNCTESSSQTEDSWADSTGDYYRYARLIEGQYIQIKDDATDNEKVRIYSINGGGSHFDNDGVEDRIAYDLEKDEWHTSGSSALVGVV